MANNYQYLDSNGLTTLWGIIKNRFGQIDGIFLGGSGATAGISNKMATIQTFNPNNLTVPGLVPVPSTPTSQVFLRGDGNWATPVGSTYAAGTYLTLSGTTINHDDSGVTAGSKGDTSAKTPGFGGTFKALSGTVDAQGHLTAFAEHNVTIPSATATTNANGLMSSTDKIKLDSVASSAEVNQNAFSNIKVGSSTVAADSKTDTLTLVGSGSISLSASTSTDTVTITGTDTTYAVATHEKDGLMSAEDKQTLDNIVTTGGEPNQDAFSYIVAGGSTVAADNKKDTLTLVGAGSVSLSATTGTDTITITGSTSVATTAANGLMSSSDKIKLDLNHYATIDSSTAETSTEKTATCPNFVLGNGAWIILQYADVSNAASTFTLNVNGTGAEPVHYLNYPTGAGAKFIARKRYLLVYHDGHWDLVGDYPEPGYGLTWRQPSSGTTTKSIIDHEFLTSAGTVGSSVASSGSTIEIPYAKYNNTGHITAKGTHIHTINNLDASAITSGTFSSAIHAPTSGATYSIASRQYVDDSIATAISGAASFQGTATSTYPAAIENHEAGQYWLVIQDGTYVDGAFECQPGDMIFAIATAGTTADFTVIQQNLSPITTDDINTICV